MSNWSSTQLTDLGRALDAKVTAGTTLLSFTKMKLGSGTETAEDIPAMTDLVSPKLVLGISSCAVSASDDTIFRRQGARRIRNGSGRGGNPLRGHAGQHAGHDAE